MKITIKSIICVVSKSFKSFKKITVKPPLSSHSKCQAKMVTYKKSDHRYLNPLEFHSNLNYMNLKLFQCKKHLSKQNIVSFFLLKL